MAVHTAEFTVCLFVTFVFVCFFQLTINFTHMEYDVLCSFFVRFIVTFSYRDTSQSMVPLQELMFSIFVRCCRNYVVQYILDLKQGWATSEVMVRLEGSYAFLAMQKFSSNVVEKCLKLGMEENRGRLVRELTASSRLGQLLQDQYANYVIQSALSVCQVCSYGSF